ncbi:putative effector of murein hydrolase [Terriglobus roseus DSM 18391]|uniref:Putative effector of murein hydrolase n=1 Tax=Terriglobus roseus (strain DSM 18391 / NRRL B-41598 / KBS 63) TaxID=926566 RepID=I3ZC64_TERRK|nr:LrgB family protein [Terriglobus roseus]AFL86832.1 putative effector of murein hydrolase [Terriglobus roseus DSM 18391]
MSAVAMLRTEPLFLVTVTIAFYLAGVWLQRRTRVAIANPTLIAIVLVGLMLWVLRLPYAQYFAGVQLLHFLLGPATVALAIPMVLSLEHLRRGLWPTLLALLAGSVTGAVSAYALVRLCGGTEQLALSMMPKSLTTPIAMGVSETIGGVPALSAVFGITAGILVAVILPGVLRLLRVNHPAATGLAAGTAGSGIAAASVIPLGPIPAAFAGVAIGMNGLLTAVLAPLLVRMMAHR